MYDRMMREVDGAGGFTDRQLIAELLWWDKNLRRCPADHIDMATPAPNAPGYLDHKPRYLRAAPRIYWECVRVARERSIL